jgi:hypothetical protein
MAWVLRARGGEAQLTFGRGVSVSDVGIFEGTWVGDCGDPLAPLRSTMPFGSGVLADGDGLFIIPPGHMLEGVYVCERADAVFASNSLVGLLVAADLELDSTVAYPPHFNESVDGIMRTTIPTTTLPIEACFHDNLRLDLDGRQNRVPKPREAPFTTYSEYVSRLSAALESAMANAPAHEPVVTVSSGYDGAAVAVLAAALGCRRAVTIADGKPVRGQTSLDDSGEGLARRLGMEVTVGGRLDYFRRDDMPEAEFLATGFSGEEVVLSGLESALSNRMLVSAFFGDGMWWMNRPPRPQWWRSDQSGSSLGEWRLRVGFVHVPLPCLGAERYRDTQRISRATEMRPWALGRRYDKPIPRRILESAGIPRGAFGEVKRAVSATVHVDGPGALAPATRAALEEFAAAEGRPVTFGRRRFPLWQRAALKVTRKLRLESLAWMFERRKFALGVLEPEFGSLLLRWATSVVRARYAGVGQDPSVDSPDA